MWLKKWRFIAGTIIGYGNIYYKYPGWWYTYHSEKYEFVSWDDDIPNIWKTCSKHVPNHQPAIHNGYILNFSFAAARIFPAMKNRALNAKQIPVT